MNWHDYQVGTRRSGNSSPSGALVGVAILVVSMSITVRGAEVAARRGQGVIARSAVNDESPTTDLGDDDDFGDLSLEELLNVQVVVTASRHEQRINTVPFAISVITAADIRAAGARSVPDALRLVPGMDVADLSGSQTAVSPRGFHSFISNMVLVLVDGRQIYDSLFGGTLWSSWPFQVEDIERIEVIRGPGGVTWGANAVNGVINIITKDPADQLGLTMTTSGGSYGSLKQRLSYGEQDGKWRFRVSGEYEANDGFDKGGSFLRKLEDDYKGGRLSLHAIYDLDEANTLTFSAGSAIVDGGLPPSPAAGIGLRRNPDSQASFLLGRLNHRVASDDRIDLTFYINDAHASPGLPAIDYRYQQIAVLFSRTFKPDENRTRTWGVDTRVDLLDTSNAAPFMLKKGYIRTAIVGVYLQDEWRPAPRWSLNLGGRIDYDFYGGFQPSARASVMYELPDDAVVYGAISRAFTISSAGGRFLNMPLVNGLVHVTANQDFKPATLMAYELGYRGTLLDRLNVGMTLFWHEYDDMTTMKLVLGPPGLLQKRLDNRSGSVSLYGAEFEAKYQVSDKLALVGNYTYQQLDWDIDEPITDRDYITPPEHKAMLGARYAVNDGFRLSGHLYYVDAVRAPNPGNPFVPRRIDPYVRLDLQAVYDFWDDKASFTLGVRNLLDGNHYEGGTLFLNDAEVPRMVFAELRLIIK